MKKGQQKEIACSNCGHSIKINKDILNLISVEAREEILDKEREKLKEEFQFEIAEKTLIINQIKEQLNAIQKKAEKQSQQHTGEAGEIVIEEILRATFKNDDVIPVGKGVKGGDVCLTIKDPMGSAIGKILFESKRTQTFSSDFIPKAKSDQRNCGADLVVIVTETFPKELGNKFGLKDGVYVCGFGEVRALSIALRESVVRLREVVISNQDTPYKVEKLYSFLTSDSFRREMEFLLETFCDMQEDLNKEKRSISLIWSKRQESIDSVLDSVSRFFGTIKGIAGKAVPTIEQLELPENNNE